MDSDAPDLRRTAKLTAEMLSCEKGSRPICLLTMAEEDTLDQCYFLIYYTFLPISSLLFVIPHHPFSADLADILMTGSWILIQTYLALRFIQKCIKSST